MSASFDLLIEGVAVCAPGLVDWAQAQPVLAGEAAYVGAALQRPAPGVIAPNERRRAPDSVLLALAVAEAACAMAGRAPASMPNVFASAYGDLAINDYLCAELARAPLDLSPIKFHNSVHNAPAGYWTIATGCMASSSAVSAGVATVGAALLETALLACRENRPALFVAVDTATAGPLADVIPSTAAFAAALVLAPGKAGGLARCRLHLGDGVAPGLAPLPASLHSVAASCPAAAALPLLAALARRESMTLALAAGPAGTRDLQLEMSF